MNKSIIINSLFTLSFVAWTPLDAAPPYDRQALARTAVVMGGIVMVASLATLCRLYYVNKGLTELNKSLTASTQATNQLAQGINQLNRNLGTIIGSSRSTANTLQDAFNQIQAGIQHADDTQPQCIQQ